MPAVASFAIALQLPYFLGDGPDLADALTYPSDNGPHLGTI
jgi:hypothetical protein